MNHALSKIVAIDVSIIKFRRSWDNEGFQCQYTHDLPLRTSCVHRERVQVSLVFAGWLKFNYSLGVCWLVTTVCNHAPKLIYFHALPISLVFGLCLWLLHYLPFVLLMYKIVSMYLQSTCHISNDEVFARAHSQISSYTCN